MYANCHRFFETLGTGLKMDILLGLREKPLGVSELSEGVGQERSKVSHALLSLLGCGFVHVRKEGKRRIYSVNEDTILPLLDLAERHVRTYCRACRGKGG